MLLACLYSRMNKRSKPRRCYSYSRAYWENLNAEIENITERINKMDEEGTNIDIMWNEFKTLLLSAIEGNIPSHTQRRNNRYPWINKEVKRLLRKKKRLYKQAKKTGKWENDRFLQKECRRQMRAMEWEYINNTIEEGLRNNNTKPFWSYVKSRRQDSTGVAPLKKGTTLQNDGATKAHILLDQFKFVFTPNDGTPLPKMKGAPFPTLDQLTIDTNGVAKLLKNLNPGKACGPDGIPNMILKTCADVIAPALTCMYRRSIQMGQLPVDWWSANITAVFKKGERNKAENYRPVSLTSVACKLLEHIIYQHLRNHLERHNILTERNHGIRSCYSCETQLITTLHDLFKSYDAGKQTDVIILDFSKAFDTVPHNKLLHKLDRYGIRGPIHKWLTNFPTKRKVQIVLEGEASGEATVDSGVSQGTVLGPLLFLCHINDLPEAVNSKVRLFADDCLLYRDINTPQDHITLQEDLRHLEDWAKKWGMCFSAQKCYILLSRSKSTHMYSLNGVFLKQVQQHPYLGVIISDDLKWGKHNAYISRKAGATVGFLRWNLRNCPKECRRLAYIALVRSRLEYAETVWDPYYQQDMEKLERVQRQAARFITKDYRTREPGSCIECCRT